jgi:archaemetzincin
MKRIIYLQKVGRLDQSMLISLKNNLMPQLVDFNCKVEYFKDKIALTDLLYNKSKEQYNASKILKKIVRNIQKKEIFRILGLIDEDIYSKDYNFIFGLANRRLGVAIVSLTRLREDFYKRISNIYRKQETKKEIEERLLKEAIHELGHTFGLNHCDNLCVMRFSNSLKDTDKKPKEFCNACFKIVNRFFKKLEF